MGITKEIFRKKCLQMMKTSPNHNRVYKNSLVNKKLYNLLKDKKIKSILFYYPLGFEVDILKTLKKMRRKVEVFIPFMEEESFKMVTFRLPLTKKKFGVFEAGNSFKKIQKVDIAVVPAVGVDVNFQRIGFGKGMYDRFFSKLKKKPYTIFIQSQFCFSKSNLCNSYDVYCDILITPTIILKNKSLKRKYKDVK